ncbi:MAG: FAD-dependent tricarballylate dehydrogenase TcuA [Betaproteobacteria bacterium]|nr:FAD-dependent tricarballylate dehydrogenase TcuA [Betaproteobacteria bacterium]
MKNAPYDVIVVGAGNAALCAAISAQEQGAKVLVLERAPQEKRGGNSAFTGGGFRMVYKGLEDVKKFVPDLTADEIASTDFGGYTREEYLDDLGRMTEYRIDPELAEILVDKSTETAEWLRKKGVRFVPRYGAQAYKHEGRFQFFGGLVVEVVGAGLGLSEAEFKAAEKQGITIRYNARATSLLYGRAGVEGVRLVADRVEEDVRAGAVVLACGGFEANREWRTSYLGPGWDLAKVRGTRYNTGDGIKMALDIGALPCGNWSGAHADPWDLNAPEYGDRDIGDAFGKHSFLFGIMVNANGLRFVDEGADFSIFTYAKYGRKILEQPALMAWQIFDSKVIDRLRSTYRIKQVTKVTANTLEELAGKLEGVDKEQALQTLKEFNAAVRKEVPFNPNIKDGRGTTGLTVPKSNWAQTIDTPPFEAYGVTCGITFTYGGLKITTKAEVVDAEEKPIPGLYAAGELVGGVFYFNYPGGAGLMNGAVFGRVAGASAAQYTARR